MYDDLEEEVARENDDMTQTVNASAKPFASQVVGVQELDRAGEGGGGGSSVCTILSDQFWASIQNRLHQACGSRSNSKEFRFLVKG